jgi:hypothetical protein
MSDHVSFFLDSDAVLQGRDSFAGLGPTRLAAEPEHPKPPPVVEPVTPPVIATSDHPRPTDPAPKPTPEPTPVVTGGQTITGTQGPDDIKGGIGADKLSGGDGADMLRGEAGNDTLVGGGGADTLSGGRGSDLLTGGPGHDLFQLGGPDVDRITDFTHGEDRLAFGDHLKLTDATFAQGTAASYADALSFANSKITSGSADLVAVQVGANVVVFADSTHHNHIDATAMLIGKTLSGLSVSDIF